ncbi:MAG: hypothetical protein K9J13_03975 [Saprospiraceae bacterium]|nr:hypothetical protein [Saprospiraceae bacterium]
MSRRQNILLIFLILCSLTNVYPQRIELSIIQNPTENDSSYYDINRIDDNNFWIVGKNGVINNINNEGKIESVKYPNKGINLYKVENLGKDLTIICGDKGSIYLYDKKNKSWCFKQIHNYEHRCFYSMSVVNDSTAFICGGHRRIGTAKKAIPSGFILKTSDKGQTWTEVYQNKKAMVWSVDYNKSLKKVYAVCYSPFRSAIICSDENGTEWTSVFKNLKGLFHDFAFTANQQMMLVGSRNHKFNNKGKIIQPDLNSFFTSVNHGALWGLTKLGNTFFACGYLGATCYKKSNGEWFFLKNPLNTNLYEFAVIDNNSAYIIGSWKTILKISISN